MHVEYFGAAVSAGQLPLPWLYSATGRARVKYTPLPLPLMPLQL